ncbi:hypothetical protein GCM10010399_38330 [Dactylosporangium fulvum]|uniref:DUF1579 domain-containing protein n=1 Tax=Dactylosporangium fulvum TaxID=53359 RepID=A0ABY5W5U5_9ACTN|nr:hypothetical protein [Dactylosporangium fulvum]UWP84073.1 hypothetical protein Dfulv_07420 [Dactylosporangium fulvum]
MSEVRRLRPLLGLWDMEATVGGVVTSRGWTSFAWADEGEFLVQRADAGPPGEDVPRDWLENSPFPTVSVIGYDDSSEAFTMLYSDARGALRVYGLSLVGREWRMWRAAEGFHQRFKGVLSDDGYSISAFWERSGDGRTWLRDFDMTYERPR